MFYKKLFPFILALTMTAFVAGCAATRTRTPQAAPQGYTRVPSPTRAPSPRNVVQNIKGVQPPKQLEALRSNAEGIFTDAEAKNWSSIDRRAKQLRTSYNEVRPVLESAGIAQNLINNVTGSIDSLEKQVAAKNLYETKVYANRITKYLPDVETSYKMNVPADLYKIGYLSREITLDSEKDNWAGAANNATSLRSSWNSLQTRLSSAHKSDGAKFSAELGNLDKAIKAKNKTDIRKYINLLDGRLATLKTDFSKQVS